MLLDLCQICSRLELLVQISSPVQEAERGVTASLSFVERSELLGRVGFGQGAARARRNFKGRSEVRFGKGDLTPLAEHHSQQAMRSSLIATRLNFVEDLQCLLGSGARAFAITFGEENFCPIHHGDSPEMTVSGRLSQDLRGLVVTVGLLPLLSICVHHSKVVMRKGTTTLISARHVRVERAGVML